MQAALLVALIGAWIVSAGYDPVFVNELKGLVKNRSDRKLLEALKAMLMVNRSTKETVVNEILKLQNEKIQGLLNKLQNAYAIKVKAKKLRRKTWYDKGLSMAAADQAWKDYMEQVEKINNDMAITDDDARKKIRELKAKLDKKNCRLAAKLKKFT